MGEPMNKSTTPAPPYPTQQPQGHFVPGHWVPAGPQLPKSSGYRVATGVLVIGLGCFLLLVSLFMVRYAIEYEYTLATVMAVSTVIAALVNLTSGILLLVNHRGRGRGAPVTVLAAAALPLLLTAIGVIGEAAFQGVLVMSSVLAIPVFVVMGIGLAKEKRGA